MDKYESLSFSERDPTDSPLFLHLQRISPYLPELVYKKIFDLALVLNNAYNHLLFLDDIFSQRHQLPISASFSLEAVAKRTQIMQLSLINEAIKTSFELTEEIRAELRPSYFFSILSYLHDWTSSSTKDEGETSISVESIGYKEYVQLLLKAIRLPDICARLDHLNTLIKLLRDDSDERDLQRAWAALKDVKVLFDSELPLKTIKQS